MFLIFPASAPSKEVNGSLGRTGERGSIIKSNMAKAMQYLMSKKPGKQDATMTWNILCMYGDTAD